MTTNLKDNCKTNVDSDDDVTTVDLLGTNHNNNVAIVSYLEPPIIQTEIDLAL